MVSFEKIVLNVPHSSIDSYQEGWLGVVNMFPIVKRWTDWHTDILFSSNDRCVSMVRYDKSRFYCDVERLMNDPMEKIGQGIIYKEFEGFKRDVSSSLHDKLMYDYHLHRQRLSYNITSDKVLLIDCHSFPSDLSDVDICIGFNSDWSMDIDVVNYLVDAFKAHGYTIGINAPYSNSITPPSEFEYVSVMIEVNKRVYLDEDSLLIKPTQFTKLKQLLHDIYLSLLGKS